MFLERSPLEHISLIGSDFIRFSREKKTSTREFNITMKIWLQNKFILVKEHDFCLLSSKYLCKLRRKRTDFCWFQLKSSAVCVLKRRVLDEVKCLCWVCSRCQLCKSYFNEQPHEASAESSSRWRMFALFPLNYSTQHDLFIVLKAENSFSSCIASELIDNFCC